ncbi:FAD-binding protein [Gymnodinialimonas ceratoperidinii]|uniref:FAD-binding protein n=1 Tax=Gymnodinialimonas ceratoperidinii TaxID=2856823 RepID=A0A8F6TX62_9RHOB|nr:FAD-binding protein [Gymnodinialimonas ceratoperidinii]QXT39569.1 FAD-binding protein [Gymnodinialimonas ceratoperidinii]
MLSPADENELAEMVRGASGPLRIVGGGTRDIGVPVEGEVLSTAGLSGISLYEPGALTLVAGAGTPLAEIKAVLAAENQRLAFEPMDHRALLGSTGAPTLGGVVATNASGARRIAVGACRDHLLGVRFVDGSGQVLKNGGRVMKNVTGYDLVKLMAGAYGTLGVLSEVSLKVLPRPEISATVVLHELSLSESVAAMSAALGSPFEVTGAAARRGDTCLRIEGFEASVAYRARQLSDLLAPRGEVSVLDHDASEAIWRKITDVADFAASAAVTRVSVAPGDAPALAEAHLAEFGGALLLDWGGGLMWFASAADSTAEDQARAHLALQHAVGSTPSRGHATLIKAPAVLRKSVPVFQPEAPGIAALSCGIRARFDPRAILNPGLMRGA